MSDIPYDPKLVLHLMQESAEFSKREQYDQAILCLKKVLELKLDISLLGIPGLKNAFLEKTTAISEFGKIVTESKLTEYQIDFVFTVRNFRLDKWDENIENAVLLSLKNPSINPQNLTAVGLELLHQKHFSASDPLLLALLETVVLPDANLEKLLKKKRMELLLHSDDIDFLESYRPFIYALSTQCSINEYVYALSDSENALVEQLMELIVSMLNILNPKTKLIIVLLSCYRPLYTTPLVQTLFKLSSIENDPSFFRILKMQILDPMRENELVSTIPILNPIEDEISQKVRLQYEENPYPRWTRLERQNPITFQQGLINLFPQLVDRFDPVASPTRILVAGCGTGKHTINCALCYLNCQVTAIDLSVSSLAYAKRMAEEMDVANITFIQGDILNQEEANEKFDVINCSGVLHHMQDPIAGWNILTNMLTKDGWMNIGLYSEIARRKIVAARQYVVDKGYRGTLEDIRNCRENILNISDGDPIKSVVLWEDFYTTSTCRDLLFHVHEVHFTLLQIEEILAKLKLEFIGFDTPSSIKLRFKKMFPEDPWMVSLSNWHQFEQENPDTFLTMYQFWVIKKS